jgi:hypothetical protein
MRLQRLLAEKLTLTVAYDKGSKGANGSRSCFALQYFGGTATRCGEGGAFGSDCQSVPAPGDLIGLVCVFAAKLANI